MSKGKRLLKNQRDKASCFDSGTPRAQASTTLHRVAPVCAPDREPTEAIWLIGTRHPRVPRPRACAVAAPRPPREPVRQDAPPESQQTGKGQGRQRGRMIRPEHASSHIHRFPEKRPRVPRPEHAPQDSSSQLPKAALGAIPGLGLQMKHRACALPGLPWGGPGGAQAGSGGRQEDPGATKICAAAKDARRQIPRPGGRPG